MRFAYKRQDVNTLRRLRPLAEAWTHRLREASIPTASTSDCDTTDDPLTMIDNMLFQIALNQQNWSAMHAVLKQKPDPSAWTPFMCSAFLRSPVAVTMLKKDPSLVVKNTTSNGDDGAYQELDPASLGLAHLELDVWNLFRQAMKQYLGFLTYDKSDRSQSILPNQFLVLLLELYARTGLLVPAAQLLSSARDRLLTNFTVSRSSHESKHVLHRGPSRMLTCKEATIPGPRLLNAMLLAALNANSPGAAVWIFSTLTKTKFTVDWAISLNGFSWPSELVLEPDNLSLLLMMDAFDQQFGLTSESVLCAFEFLKCVERQWGLYNSCNFTAKAPLLIEFGVMDRLMSSCMRAHTFPLFRKILRFQEGLFRRELRLLQKSSGNRLWRQYQNGLPGYHKWSRTLRHAVARNWAYERQLLLLTLGRKVAQHYSH